MPVRAWRFKSSHPHSEKAHRPHRGGGAGRRRSLRGRPRRSRPRADDRGGRHPACPVAVGVRPDPPVGVASHLRPADRRRPGRARRADLLVGPGRAGAMALPARGERARRRAAPVGGAAAPAASRRRRRVAERPLPRAEHDGRRRADRRRQALGPDACDRGRGDEDRDHRRRPRRDEPVLLADRARVSRRLSQGPDAVRDSEGDRPADVPAARGDAGSTRSRPSTRSTRSTRPTSRGSRPASTAQTRTAP